jgi:hypothetical protein
VTQSGAVPQGAKSPASFATSSGTAEAVPFPKPYRVERLEVREIVDCDADKRPTFPKKEKNTPQSKKITGAQMIEIDQTRSQFR